jgi:hypothetical protein
VSHNFFDGRDYLILAFELRRESRPHDRVKSHSCGPANDFWFYVVFRAARTPATNMAVSILGEYVFASAQRLHRRINALS